MGGDKLNSETVHAGILKTIYLFLENNNLQETAAEFLSEIRRKFKTVNFNEMPARTLILRPLDNGEIDGNAVSNENIIILISGKSNIQIDLNQIADEESVDASTGDLTCPKSVQCENSDVEINVVEGYNTNSAETEIANLEKTLFKLQDEHTKLIQVASQLTSALGALEKDQKQNFHNILNKYRDAFPDLYAYASQNESELVNNKISDVKIEPVEENEELCGEIIPLEEKASLENLCDSRESLKEDILEKYNNVPSVREGIKTASSCGRPRVSQIPKKISAGKFKATNLTWCSNRRQSLEHSPVKRNLGRKLSSSAPHRRVQSKALEETVLNSVILNVDNDRSLSSIGDKIEDRTVNTPVDIIDDVNTIINEVNVNFINNSIENLNNLDYALIKNDLVKADVDVKLKLLQALRWRLTRSNKTPEDYVAYDILHLNCGIKFLESYFIATPPLQEEMARFINTLASLSKGREYLHKYPLFLSQIFLPLLVNDAVPELTRGFMIATAQKLSLFESIRDLFVKEGVIEWLIMLITKNHAEMLNYEAEYTIALFANMCIHKETRNRCEIIPDKVVMLLMTLLDSPHECCRNYLNTILYSMLSVPLVNEKACNLGLYEKLEKRLTKTTEIELVKQLELIISLKSKRNNEEIECHVNEEIIANDDFLEPELDLHETIYPDPSGEDFLQNYTAVNPATIFVSNSVNCICLSCDHENQITENTRTTAVQASADSVNKFVQTKEDTVNIMEKFESQSDLQTKLQELRKLFTSPTTSNDFMPCSLNFYCYNQAQDLKKNNKYTCDCYDVINEIVKEKQNTPRLEVEPLKIGRKPSNVTFGPFIPKVVYECPSNLCNVVEKNVFRSKSRIKRTP